MFDIVGFLILMALIALFGFLTARGGAASERTALEAECRAAAR